MAERESYGNPQCVWEGCRERVPQANAKYCGDRHKQAAARARQRERRETALVRRLNDEFLDDHDAGVLSVQDIWDRIHEGAGSNRQYPSRAQIGKALGKARELRADLIASGEWDSGVVLDEWFPHSYVDLRDAARQNSPDYQSMLDEMVSAFLRFEERFFQLPTGEPYLRAQFHVDWIRAILNAYFTGGYLQILSPPRHGKSELLVHFAVWLIAWNPNIRIMWVGPNLPIAKDMVGAVAAQLKDNEELREVLLGPGQTFHPTTKGAGQMWASDGFKVVNRTVVGIKAPTMIAVGRNGKILSRDCDLIVADDIEDYDGTAQPASRAATRRWFGTQLDSRKEEHTGMVVIGSRQHPDDLYGYHLESAQWDSIVNSAHDPECGENPDDIDAHTDCMLFPEIRTYRWLMSKKDGADDRDDEGVYEMVYLNDPTIDGVSIFSKDHIEAARNPSRGVGVPDGIGTYWLVGGVDPAATGYQAGFLWAVTMEPTEHDRRQPKYWMVDVDNRRGGGIDAALELFDRWHHQYGCTHFVVEENGFQRAIRADDKVRRWASANGVHLEPHQTQGGNKHDPNYGVGAMARLFPRQVDLPYGTPDARTKTNLYQRQMLAFGGDFVATGSRNRKSDVLMASWFPMKAIRRLIKEQSARVQVDHDPMFSGYQQSTWNRPPW